MARPRSTSATGSGPGNGSGLPAGKGAGFATFFWLIALVAGPVFGYFLTGISGWVDTGNWRTMMTIRLVVCFVWPVGAALIHGIVNARSDAKWTHKTTLALMVFSSYGIWPAFNAYRDLRSGPERVELVVTDTESEGHRSRSHRYTSYEVFLSDGNSYYVTEEVFDKVRIGTTCAATRLPHTDILLDLRPG